MNPWMLISAAMVLATASLAWAQRDAASKADDAAYEAPYFYNTSDMYQQNAYEHAQVLQQVTSGGGSLPQAVAKEHAAGIRANLQAAQKHLANLRQAAKSNPAATKTLDEIEAHHKRALAATDQLDAASAKGKADAATINKHASTIASEMKAAQAKHKQIAKHLKIQPPKPSETK